jgi:hypothetical protein
MLSMLLSGLFLVGTAWAGDIDGAKAQVADGTALVKKAAKTRKKKKKPEMYVKAARHFAAAYKAIYGGNLQNDAPELASQITKAITDLNEKPEVQAMRRDLLKQAIDAAAADKLADAYDRLADLRTLDPRIKTVEYALNVVGENIGGN